MRKTELSANIPAPVWKGALQFHTGGVTRFYGPMESGKTRVMIALILYLVEYEHFPGNRIFCNTWLDIPGAHWLRNAEMRKVLRRALNTETGAGRWNRCIFAIMDADDVYSHIDQADKECYTDIKKASQAYKRNIHLFYEVHDGLGVPKYLRDKTEVSMYPVPNERDDSVTVYVADAHYNVNYQFTIGRISSMHGRYRRFDENY